MQLGLMKSLMDAEFYDLVKTRLSPEFFGANELKVKLTLDNAHKQYKRTLTVDEVEALFFVEHPTITTADKNLYKDMFKLLRKEQPMGHDVIDTVLSGLWRNVIGERVADVGFRLVNGETTNLMDLRRILEDHAESFLPKLTVDFEESTIEELLVKYEEESKWTFNLGPLSHQVAGVNGGHFVVVGARPNSGKTSFHASLAAGPGGWAEQGARVGVLCNEEAAYRIKMRYITASCGIPFNAMKSNMATAHAAWDKIATKVSITNATGYDLNRVEAFCKSYKPDVLILDMIDKVNVKGGYARDDQRLRAVYVGARDIAKEYDCAVFGFSQVSAEGEGRTHLDQSQLEGSKTGKAAEADLMLLIGKAAEGDGNSPDTSSVRWINIAKNKLSGVHCTVVVSLDGTTARFGE
jgi:hypothetical protein